MKYFLDYNGHVPIIIGKRKFFDNTIMTFDIETSSYLILDGKQIPAIDYLKLSKDEQEKCIYQANMYIWMFSIGKDVYYGRTWKELDAFLNRIEFYSSQGRNVKKIVYVHNLSYEFQFLRNEFKFKSVFARKSRKVIKAELEKYNIEFRCTLMMTNAKLEKLPELYGLDVRKLTGNLDYNLIRNSKTNLTEKEFTYCENDCLVLYEYLKKMLLQYGNFKQIPLTQTGQVRKELKERIEKDYKYLWQVRRGINTNTHVYNLLIDAFMGGYTHANWTKADEIIKNVVSYDFTSSYPYVMCTYKYPMSIFRKCKITKRDELLPNLAYLIYVKFTNISCKYINNFISQSKCKRIKNGRYDNGRLIGADEIEIVLTDIDFKFIYDSYTFESYEFFEVYWSMYNYLPEQFINFILDKYVIKTEYKNVEGKELDYQIEKQKFNSLYGMSVTNNIRDNVIFDNEKGWSEEPLSNEDIEDALKEEKKRGYLNFAWRGMGYSICKK